jgi:four helix bundle protein
VTSDGWLVTSETPQLQRLRSHKDLEVWQLAMDLASEIYAITARFPKEELYGLSMQARRCAVSIPSNIAECAARKSTKEFIQYLHVALGSVAELETQLLLAKKMSFIGDNRSFDMLEQVRKMLVGLLRALKQKPVTRHSSPVT